MKTIITPLAILILISAFVAVLIMTVHQMSHHQTAIQWSTGQQIDYGDIAEPQTPPTPLVPLNLDRLESIELSQPYIHKNMTVFIISRPQADIKIPDYITLEEGIAQGKVKISEKEQAQVQRLQIENDSDLPLFLQSGDIVKGGKQDRTVQVSVTVPPHSGKIDFPSLCVEQSRWTGGGVFGFTNQNAPSKGMRMANYKGDQSGQWIAVQGLKIQWSMTASLGESKTSSVNEELENPKVKEAIAEYENVFTPLLKEYPDAIGMAFALNGEINTIEIFQSQKLFQKVSFKLLKSWALESIASQPTKKTRTVDAEEIRSFIAEMEKGNGSENTYNDNKVIRIENDKGMTSDLIDKSKNIIHRQILKK